MICGQYLPVAFFGAAVFLLVIAIAIRDAERKLSEVSRALERRADDELEIARERLREMEAKQARDEEFERKMLSSIVYADDASFGATSFGRAFTFGEREE